MNKNTVEEVISRFGSQQRVAELLGIWQTAVSGWVRRGAIPARRQEQLLTIAQQEGVKLTPEDPFEAAPRFKAAAKASGYGEDNAWIMKIGETRELKALAQVAVAGHAMAVAD